MIASVFNLQQNIRQEIVRSHKENTITIKLSWTPKSSITMMINTALRLLSLNLVNLMVANLTQDISIFISELSNTEKLSREIV